MCSVRAPALGLQRALRDVGAPRAAAIHAVVDVSTSHRVGLLNGIQREPEGAGELSAAGVPHMDTPRGHRDRFTGTRVRQKSFFAFLEDNQRVTYTYNVSADVIWLLSV
jgi:hypothetical protein